MIIFVQISRGQVKQHKFQLFVTQDEIIHSVKSKIVEKIGIPIDQQILTFNDIVLGNDKNMTESGINDNAILKLVHRTRVKNLNEEGVSDKEETNCLDELFKFFKIEYRHTF